ncbi:uncharacterized protein ACA1_392980 [Acanthamoeba castellanii str. Neff]|uniref:UBA domain-containing protein n=1 Tax=Acanthamoeba castellanii (strain ATCC 30010 / Neff) TaxID=1257118 RepID=L8H0C4_ACACF|nr:uncharacterized protein ACA1_392980 [Acanthamoeba castellanii str. Neff]ELR18652.1 hypothetical protein ACA1_392980 [Acanthamoeba castellanii str. Neff]
MEVDAGLLGTLVAMGFEQEAAANALLITNNASLDEALDYLQRCCLEAGEGGAPGGSTTDTKKATPDVQLPENPTSLADYGYHFNDEGELRHLETGTPFQFINQKHYEAMGDMIVRHIQEAMLKAYQLTEQIIPLHDVPYEMPRSCLYMSPEWETAEVLLLLTHGSGNVRAGQWARKPCFNDSLQIGSVLPYIKKAQEAGWAVIVLNPNLNEGTINGKRVPIARNESPEAHYLYVWDTFVSKAQAKHVLMVSHSYGGVSTINLIEKREKQVLQRLRALALTDSIHFFKHRRITRQGFDWLATNCIDWVSSDLPLDSPVDNKADCYCVSAGTNKHEHTSGFAIESVFNFFQARLEVAAFL